MNSLPEIAIIIKIKWGTVQSRVNKSQSIVLNYIILKNGLLVGSTNSYFILCVQRTQSVHLHDHEISKTKTDMIHT